MRISSHLQYSEIMITEELYRKTTREIDKVHVLDKSESEENGILYPAEWLYSKRMLMILDMINERSSFRLKLAVQCQHLERWGVPRSNYTYDRRGYHEWRRAVMDYQLKRTIETLSITGMQEDDIKWITNVLREQGNKSNPDAQIIMDVACLVFLKWYMEPFSAKHESEKVTDILKKTMRKMSDNGIDLIPKLSLSLFSKQMLEQTYLLAPQNNPLQ